MMNFHSLHEQQRATAATTAITAVLPLKLRTLQRAVTQGAAVDIAETAQGEAFSTAWDALVGGI